MNLKINIIANGKYISGLKPIDRYKQSGLW